jgi:triosephosphate isomerase
MNVRKKFVGGNWKMNGNLKLLHEFSNLNKFDDCDVVLFLPFTLLSRGKIFLQVSIGAQNCNEKQVGPYTGEIS